MTWPQPSAARPCLTLSVYSSHLLIFRFLTAFMQSAILSSLPLNIQRVAQAAIDPSGGFVSSARIFVALYSSLQFFNTFFLNFFLFQYPFLLFNSPFHFPFSVFSLFFFTLFFHSFFSLFFFTFFFAGQ